MKESLPDPMARATVRWLLPDQGGRRSGPPPGPMYVSNMVFVLGGEAEVQPGWPQTADLTLSIWLERVSWNDDLAWTAKVDFPVRELAAPYVAPNTDFLVMEGPRIVAEGRLTEVYDWDVGAD